MTRRVVPWTFLVGLALCAVLLLNDGVKAARPGSRVPNVRGRWDGFSLDADGTVGHVLSDISQQSARRIAGEGRLLAAGTGRPLATYNFAGMLGDDGVITATGKTPAGRFALHSGVQLFAGTEGVAGIMDAQLQFVPRRGPASQVAALLLRPFPDGRALDLTDGEGVGVCRSLVDPTFVADMTLQFREGKRNAFPGSIRCVPDAGPIAPFSWECRATVSDGGRLIVIAQGRVGRMIVDGAILPASPRASSLTDWAEAASRGVNGTYLLQFHDGKTDYGAINFSLTPTLR